VSRELELPSALRAESGTLFDDGAAFTKSTPIHPRMAL
jgi:hypothetical protein